MIESYRLIWALLTPTERWRFALILFLTLIMAVFELITVAGILPLLTVLASPEIIETEPALIWFTETFGLVDFRETALALGAVVFIVVVVGMVVRAVVTYAQIRFALSRTYSLAVRLLHRHLGQDYAFYLNRNTATLSQSLLSEIDVVVRDSILPAVLLISNVTILLLVGGFLLYTEPYVAMSALGLLVGVYALAFLFLRRRMALISQSRMAANKERFTVAQEITGSLKEIKVMGLEQTSLNRFKDPARDMARHSTLGLVMQRLPRFALEAMLYGGFVAMVLILIVLRGGNIVDLVPVLGLLALSATKLLPALQQIYLQLSAIRLSVAELGRLYEDMQTTAELPILPADRDDAALPLNRELRLRDVIYHYPGADCPTLKGLNLHIDAGTTVGIVGGTGAGKTTVIDLILGLLQPGEGAVEVDDVSINADNLRAWQRNVGYVPQSIFLSDETVAANIAFGVPAKDIDMARVEAAARRANLHDFVMTELPDGYATRLGERGLRLSGGQRQRIGVARALYRDPGVLILDEATSALDTLTERIVMDAVRALGGRKTVIMVAHRLSTVEACDKIFLLKDGRLEAEGPYSRLIEDSDIFRRMTSADT